jgi:hypothetical protein
VKLTSETAVILSYDLKIQALMQILHEGEKNRNVITTNGTKTQKPSHSFLNVTVSLSTAETA